MTDVTDLGEIIVDIFSAQTGQNYRSYTVARDNRD